MAKVDWGKTTSGVWIHRSGDLMLRLRRNRDGWKGTVHLKGRKLPEEYRTSPNLTSTWVQSDFHDWAIKQL